MVYAAPNSAWVARIRPILAKKARLGVDSWGGQDREVRHILGPIEELFAEEFPEYRPFPFGAKRQIDQLVRHMLLAEPLVEQFGALFRGVTEREIDELMQSFQFKNCVQRTELAQLLASYA